MILCRNAVLISRRVGFPLIALKIGGTFLRNRLKATLFRMLGGNVSGSVASESP